MPCKSFINQSCGRTLGVGCIISTLPLARGRAADFFAAGANGGSGTGIVDLALFAANSIGEYGLAMIARAVARLLCELYIDNLLRGRSPLPAGGCDPEQ